MSPRGVFNTERGIVVRPVPEDPAGAGGVRLRVASVGICGSDLWVMSQGPSPFVVGHEFAGHTDDGTLAAVYPLSRCGTCERCAAGAYNLCDQVFVGTRGLGSHGGMCEELLVDERDLVPLPAGLAPENAGLVEPCAVAVHALDRARVRDGQRIAVVGAGALGLTVAAVAKGAGHPTAILARHAHQRAAAERLGLSLGVGSGYDVVIDAAGTEAALAQAAELLAPGGTLLLLGMYPPGIGFPAQALMMKEADVLTSTAYCVNRDRNDFLAAAEHLRDHPETAGALVTHRFGLHDAATAFATAGDRAGGAIKVVVHPDR